MICCGSIADVGAAASRYSSTEYRVSANKLMVGYIQVSTVGQMQPTDRDALGVCIRLCVCFQ